MNCKFRITDLFLRRSCFFKIFSLHQVISAHAAVTPLKINREMLESVSRQLLRCYNQGCGMEFDPEENHDEACVYHPGAPYFHDAYKSWSCCKKRSVDFTEFLNMKGCAKSPHNPVKPPEAEKRGKGSDEVIVYQAKPIARESQDHGNVNDPMTSLNVTVAPSLKQLLAAEKNAVSGPENDAACEGKAVPVGTCCKNPGCKASYQGPSSDEETCIHHNGQAIFHEGMKYWSCCGRKTTDFQAFLNQEGCASGNHCWVQKKVGGLKATCRRDWHQTGTHVFIAYYAKGVEPAKSSFKANTFKLEIDMTFGDKVYGETILLRGPIDPKESAVSLGANKVEVKMRKASALSWKDLGDLRMDEEPTPASLIEEPSVPAEESDVDLSDL